MVEAMSSVTPTAAAPARSNDLTQRDWLEAGQSLLRRGGLRALKLRPLADELRVSTGSFYHHFGDFDAYQGRLATYFAETQVADMVASLKRATPDPIDRIRLLGQTVRRRGLSRLGIAMRAWAESDPRARLAVDKHDSELLGFIGDCLEEAGFDREEADIRAYALMMLGHGKIHAPHLDMETLFESLLTILATKPMAA
jgi:AcrR family transcriptional regulator